MKIKYVCKQCGYDIDVIFYAPTENIHETTVFHCAKCDKIKHEKTYKQVIVIDMEE